MAVKELFVSCETEAAMRQFYREIQLLSALEHKHIVGFIGACLDPEHPCIVLEFCMCSVLDVLQDETQDVSLSQILLTARDVAEGCIYLHGQEKPILHRDLKSGNILLTSTGSAKVRFSGLQEAFLVVLGC